MNELEPRKKDFIPKYHNAHEIIEDDTLQPAEQVCELVKHYAMCLFGLAADISDYHGKMNEKDNQLADLRKANQRLSVANTSLRAQLQAQGEEPQSVFDELTKLRKQNAVLKNTLERNKENLAALQSDEVIATLQKALKSAQQRITHLKRRNEDLEAQNKALMLRKGANDNGN